MISQYRLEEIPSEASRAWRRFCRLSIILCIGMAYAYTGDARAALFPSSARGTYKGTIKVVDTKYGVNVTTSSAYRIGPNSTRFTTARDAVYFGRNRVARNANWVSARYTVRKHSVIIDGEFRDSSSPTSESAGNFRYLIRFRPNRVVHVASTSVYRSGGRQTVQFAGRK